MAVAQSTRDRAIAKRRAEIMPLTDFDQEKQAEIAAKVAEPFPPEQWIYFGVKGSNRPLASIRSRAWYEWHWDRGINPDEDRRESVPRWLREAVIARDGYVCQLCTEPVEPTDVHLDHVKPYSKGGPTDFDNLQVTHSLCNIRKGARY